MLIETSSLADVFLVNRTAMCLNNLINQRPSLTTEQSERLRKSSSYLSGLSERESHKGYVKPQEIERCIDVIDSAVQERPINQEDVSLSVNYLLDLGRGLRAEYNREFDRFYESTE